MGFRLFREYRQGDIKVRFYLLFHSKQRGGIVWSQSRLFVWNEKELFFLWKLMYFDHGLAVI